MVVAGDIDLVLSGGVSNTDPAASLGGAKSTQAGAVVADDVANEVFHDIASDDASAGITLYSGLYYENTNVSDDYLDPVIYFSSQTSSGDTSAEMAIADEDVDTTIETIANEETAPSGPSFSAPGSVGAGLAIGATGDGDLAATEYRGWWLKYIVSSSASAATDTMTVAIQGDTGP